jgi:hypothetical protein
LLVNPEGLFLCGAWLVLLFASLVRYMTTTPSAEGRLLYPGIAAASLLLAVGWAVILPRQWAKPAASAALVALLGLCLATPLFAIAPRFAHPLGADARELEGLIPVTGGEWQEMRLLGVRIEPESAASGERVELTLYWEALSEVPADLNAIVRLQTRRGQIVAQWDEPPANERYPGDLWRPGDVIRDSYSIPAVAGGPTSYRVMVSLRPGDQTKRKTRSGRTARTDYRFKLVPGDVDVQPAEMERVRYRLGESVALFGYALPQGRALSDRSLPLVLYWSVLEDVDSEYTVFVHLVAPDGALLGQGDGPPLGGDYPTSAWAAGEALADPHLVRLQAGVEMDALPAGAYMLVGLYRLKEGTRLPVFDESGVRVPNDAVRILLR